MTYTRRKELDLILNNDRSSFRSNLLNACTVSVYPYHKLNINWLNSKHILMQS